MLPEEIRPGHYSLSLLTINGEVFSEESVHVSGGLLDGKIIHQDQEIQIDIYGSGPANWHAMWWISTEKLSIPTPTRYGPLWLEGTQNGRPPGFHDLPFRFDKIRLFGGSCIINENGRWSQQTVIPCKDPGDLPEVLFLQGVMVDTSRQSYGAVTRLVTLSIP